MVPWPAGACRLSRNIFREVRVKEAATFEQINFKSRETEVVV